MKRRRGLVAFGGTMTLALGLAVGTAAIPSEQAEAGPPAASAASLERVARINAKAAEARQAQLDRGSRR